MIVLPAIDLYAGNAVRLYKGDYARMTVYSDNPLSVASGFHAEGAEWVHIVDLEGAKYGTTPNFDIVSAIIANSGLSVEVGGGIRSDDTVARYLNAGAARVILGTAALDDRAFLERMVSRYGEKIAVSVDCREGMVATRGWTETSAISCEAFCAQLQQIGVKTVICTDISKDGAMNGANGELYKQLMGSFDMNIIASGGVSSLEDIRAMRQMKLYGTILGKAYYTGAVCLKDALEAAK